MKDSNWKRTKSLQNDITKCVEKSQNPTLALPQLQDEGLKKMILII